MNSIVVILVILFGECGEFQLQHLMVYKELVCLGRRKNPYRKLLHTASVSEEALEFIKRYGGSLNKEPFYRRLDRLIANHQLKDTAQLAETVERQARTIDFYTKRIKDLEQQTILVP